MPQVQGSNHGKKARKMPRAEHHRNEHGKFDHGKFMANAPLAQEAISSGETKLHRIVIAAGKDGQLHVTVDRQHGKREGGIPTKVAAGLTDFLIGMLKSGDFKVDEQGDKELPGRDDDEDVWSVSLDAVK